MTARVADLFGPPPPRHPPRVMMHAVDTGMFPDGEDAAQYLCRRCSHDSGWIYSKPREWRRGRPCPHCNGVPS